MVLNNSTPARTTRRPNRRIDSHIRPVSGQLSHWPRIALSRTSMTIIITRPSPRMAEEEKKPFYKLLLLLFGNYVRRETSIHRYRRSDHVQYRNYPKDLVATSRNAGLSRQQYDLNMRLYIAKRHRSRLQVDQLTPTQISSTSAVPHNRSQNINSYTLNHNIMLYDKTRHY